LSAADPGVAGCLGIYLPTASVPFVAWNLVPGDADTPGQEHWPGDEDVSSGLRTGDQPEIGKLGVTGVGITQLPATEPSLVSHPLLNRGRRSPGQCGSFQSHLRPASSVDGHAEQLLIAVINDDAEIAESRFEPRTGAPVLYA
jgi:hypothetical protein